LTGREFEIEARLVVTAAGAFSAHWMSLLGGRPTFPLIKAANVVTSRRAGDLALGAPTSGGRLLLVMPWQGRALVGTSHSEVPVDAGDSGVSPGELASFLDEINSAFPAMALGAADITLVHRGVVPGVRQRDGRLGLLGHHVVHDHRRDGVSGAISVAGVKYTTGRGVGEQVVDRAYEMLGTRRAPCRTGTTLLPGAFASPMQAEIGTACREAEGLLERTLMAGVVRTHGTVWRGILALCRAEPSLARPVAPGCDVPAAVLVHAVREEMALTLTDVVVRRSGIGAAGYPGPAVAQACARIVAPLLGWDEARISAELDALKAFYLPIVV
jgi:glycerol-3-phosphate dehydrogenase